MWRRKKEVKGEELKVMMVEEADVLVCIGARQRGRNDVVKLV